jgi:type IV pilus biogenesis protein CpaD/CtpE
MNKKVIISGVMMLVLLASCGGKDIDTSSDAPVSVETSTPGDASIGASIDEPVVLAQGFVEYDESYVGETKDTVLFFHQESCGSCKTMEANLIES